MATRPSAVRVFAPAKINLFLHVTGKRPDGFHDLQSLVAFADIGDELVVERDGEFAMEIEGPFAGALTGDADNLVLKAARALAARFDAQGGARFTLSKNLPVASGIGGGSADAAAALRGLTALWELNATNGAALLALAEGLGSDVPVCVASAAAWMEGRGERLTAVPPLPSVPLVLVNPGVPVATAEVFRRLRIAPSAATISPPSAFGSCDDLVRYLRTTRNDLEGPARALTPEIVFVLDALAREGAALARMSGSGATCFGIFETNAEAQKARSSIHSARPGWWSQAGRIASAAIASPKILL